MTGFNSKRDAAAAKLQEDQAKYGTSWSKDGERIDPMSVYNESAQEPVAWTTMPAESEDWCFVSGNKDPNGKLDGKWFPLYTAPPQRPWVGLTDEERDDLLDTYITADGRARAIEQALKEKNT